MVIPVYNASIIYPVSRMSVTTRRTRSSLQLEEQSARAGPGPSTSATRHIQRTRESLAPETVETIGSVRSCLSVATLPARYAVTVAVSPLDRDAAGQAVKRRRIEGEEALADAWRRDVHLEGRLDDLRKNQAARLGSGAAGVSLPQGGVKGKGTDQPDCIWYTASLKFPCTCKLPYSNTQANRSDVSIGQLELLSKAFAPGADPPLATDLDALPPHPSPRQIPLSATALQPWATGGPAIDLDPAMDEMRDFEAGSTPTRGSWPLSRRSAPCDAVGGLVLAEDQACSGNTSATGSRGGKGLLELNGLGRSSRETSLSRGVNVSRTHVEPTQNSEQRIAGSEAAPEEEWRRRRQAWRHLVCGDESYGAVLSAIPLVSGMFAAVLF